MIHVCRLFILNLICLLIQLTDCFAIMPTIRGYIDFNDKTLRDTYYDKANKYIVNCISNKELIKEDYTVALGSSSIHYILRFYFNINKEVDRNNLENAIKDLINTKIIGANIEVWDSHNDGIPGVMSAG